MLRFNCDNFAIPKLAIMTVPSRGKDKDKDKDKDIEKQYVQ